MKTKNEITTTLSKINYEFLMKHYLDPKYWRKEWIIYDYGSLKVTLKLKQIDIQSDRIVLMLMVEYKGDKKKNYPRETSISYVFIPINHPEYNETLFMQKIYSEVATTLTIIERYIVWGFPEYKQEEKRVFEKTKLLKERARAYAKEHNIKDEYIIDSIIEAFKDEYLDDYRNDIIIKYQDELLVKERLLFASFSNYEKKVKELSEKLNKTKVSKSTIEVWLRKQKDAKIDYEKLDI